MSPTLPELSVLLPETSIDLSASAADRDDAIRQAGALLVQSKSALPDYVEQMLERERVVSTYVGDGIAMPHGTLTSKSDILKDGLSLVRFAEPVEWGTERVTLVIGIAAHGRRYITLLSQLATAILDEERATELRNATTAADVQRLLAS
jgi:PTS system mannitol-specific IIA component